MNYFLLFLFAINSSYSQSISTYGLAVKAIELKDFDKAMPLLLKSISEGADTEECWSALGYIAQNQKDYAQMTVVGKNLTVINPKRKDGWYYLTVGYYQRRVMDSAVPAAKKFLEVDPDMATRANIPKILSMMSQDARGIRDSIFQTPDGKISVTLPASWSTKHLDDGKSLNWFISLEPIVKNEDLFARGATIRWIRRLSKSFELDGNTDAPFLLGFWEGYTDQLSQGTKPFHKRNIDSTAFRSGEWIGRIETTELQLAQETHRLVMFDVLVAREDEILTITIECPADDWPVYVNRFKKALDTIKLP